MANRAKRDRKGWVSLSQQTQPTMGGIDFHNVISKHLRTDQAIRLQHRCLGKDSHWDIAYLKPAEIRCGDCLSNAHR